ncbi:MAG TPA: carboxypeptidase-like regulatory domain-containing protein, partial [Chitinophaga sp.]
MWRYFLALILTCSFISTSSANWRNTGTSFGIIRGNVTNEKNEPLPYATVLVKGTTEGTTTNAAGEYHLELPDGDYTIVCQYMGYRKEEKPVKVS